MGEPNCDHETVILVPSDEGFPDDGWLCAECSTDFVPAAALSAERAAREAAEAVVSRLLAGWEPENGEWVTRQYFDRDLAIWRPMSEPMSPAHAAVVAALSPSTDDTADEWRCTVCGSDWGASFHTCWHCGQPAAPSTEGANDE